MLSVSWSFEDHSVNIKALRKGLIEHEASDTGGVPRWQSSCPDRLAEATDQGYAQMAYLECDWSKRCILSDGKWNNNHKTSNNNNLSWG